MPDNELSIVAIISGAVIGILSIGLSAGMIQYAFVGWLILNIAWWSSIAFAAGICFALGAYVTICSIDRIDNLL